MKRCGFAAGQFFLFTLAVDAAGIQSSHPAGSEALRQQSWSSRKCKSAQKRGSSTGSQTQSHSACCDPAERTAQCRWWMRGVCAASVIQDIPLKTQNTAGAVLSGEICLLQKKVNTDEDGDTGAAQYRGMSGSTLSALTIWQGPVRGAFIRNRQIDSKSLGKLKNFFKLTILF